MKMIYFYEVNTFEYKHEILVRADDGIEHVHVLNCRYTYWASSTGLTAVSKFKPRLPAQWAVGTHRKGPSRMQIVTSRMNWPVRNSTQIRN